jgi:hypothetical protein
MKNGFRVRVFPNACPGLEQLFGNFLFFWLYQLKFCPDLFKSVPLYLVYERSRAFFKLKQERGNNPNRVVRTALIEIE